MALALGAAAFAMLAWRLAYQETAGEQSSTLEGSPGTAGTWDGAVTGLLKGLVLFGSIGALGCMAGVLVWQSLQITPEQAAPVWQILLAEFGYHEGGFVWVRLLLLPLMAVLAIHLPPAGSGPARPWWEIAGLGMIVELTYSLSGHSAAFGTPFPILGDWLHLTAVSFWLGGLVPLGMMLLHRRFRRLADGGVLLDRAARHFSDLAFVSVIVLALSGVYSAYLQVRNLPALVGTRYGQVILVKAGLLALLVGLGALNQLGILPSIARQGARALRRLGQSVRVELVLGALALLAAGALTSLAPGYDALRANQRMGLHERWQGDGVRMDFRVAPVQVGDNEFGVEIADSRPGAGKVNGTALLRIQAADESTGQVQVEAKPSAVLRYSARGSYLSKMGVWDVLVIWRKNGFNDVTHVFTVDLAHWAEQTGQKINPVPPNSASILSGRALYLENCAACHGITGKGDGPAGRALNPGPSDLSQHAVPGIHSDGQLFDWITGGFPGSAMPAFKDQLTEKQRWDLVNFIRTLAK